MATVSSAPPKLSTAEQLAAMPRGELRYELVDGELVTISPAGSEHGQIAIRLSWRVARYVEECKLGATFSAETGFLISRNPDTVRAPDLAFITQQRIDQVGSIKGYWPGAPDLAVEVISPNDLFSAVEAKALGWLAAGTQLVWAVDPQQQHVTVYRSTSDISVIEKDDLLTAPDLLGEWSVKVGELFPESTTKN